MLAGVFQSDGLGVSQRGCRCSGGDSVKIGKGRSIQRKYIASLLERFEMEGCTAAPAPTYGAPLEKVDIDYNSNSQAHGHLSGEYWLPSLPKQYHEA